MAGGGGGGGKQGNTFFVIALVVVVSWEAEEVAHPVRKTGTELGRMHIVDRTC